MRLHTYVKNCERRPYLGCLLPKRTKNIQQIVVGGASYLDRNCRTKKSFFVVFSKLISVYMIGNCKTRARRRQTITQVIYIYIFVCMHRCTTVQHKHNAMKNIQYIYIYNGYINYICLLAYQRSGRFCCLRCLLSICLFLSLFFFLQPLC